MGVEIMYLGERVGEDAQDEKGAKDDPVELLEEKKIRLALDHQTPVCEPHKDHSAVVARYGPFHSLKKKDPELG